MCKACSSHSTPIIPYGTGTGLEGGIAALQVIFSSWSSPHSQSNKILMVITIPIKYCHHGHHPIPNHHHLQGGVCVNVARNMGKVVKNELIPMIITIASSEHWIRWLTSLKRISLLWSSLGWTGKPLMQRSGKLTTIFVIDDWWRRLWCCWWF